MRVPLVALLLPLALTVAACSSEASPPPGAIATCPPIALPTRDVFLAYPVPGATGVPATIGTLVIEESGVAGFASDTITISNTTGTQATLLTRGTPGPAPSPLPSPLATGAVAGTPAPFGYPIPALSPASTYAVSDTYALTLESPHCVSEITSDLGSFTTQ